MGCSAITRNRREDFAAATPSPGATMTVTTRPPVLRAAYRTCRFSNARRRACRHAALPRFTVSGAGRCQGTPAPSRVIRPAPRRRSDRRSGPNRRQGFGCHHAAVQSACTPRREGAPRESRRHAWCRARTDSAHRSSADRALPRQQIVDGDVREQRSPLVFTTTGQARCGQN